MQLITQKCSLNIKMILTRENIRNNVIQKPFLKKTRPMSPTNQKTNLLLYSNFKTKTKT